MKHNETEIKVRLIKAFLNNEYASIASCWERIPQVHINDTRTAIKCCVVEGVSSIKITEGDVVAVLSKGERTKRIRAHVDKVTLAGLSKCVSTVINDCAMQSVDKLREIDNAVKLTNQMEAALATVTATCESYKQRKVIEKQEESLKAKDELIKKLKDDIFWKSVDIVELKEAVEIIKSRSFIYDKSLLGMVVVFSIAGGIFISVLLFKYFTGGI